MKSLSVTIQSKAIEQYFSVVLGTVAGAKRWVGGGGEIEKKEPRDVSTEHKGREIALEITRFPLLFGVCH